MDVAVLGTWALRAGALAAAVAAVAPARRSSATSLLRVAVAAVTVAVGCLVWALLTGDFRLTYVADTTSRAAGWPARLAALWGGMSGSLLFWGWLLVITAAVGARVVRRTRPDLAGSATRLMAGVAAAFLTVSATVAEPFGTLAIPAIDGGGLNPILQRPAMLYHPPLLYAGLVAMLIPFAAALVAVARGATDAVWLGIVRRTAGAAWVLLTAGMLAGAHWAYGELGWGGFWAWDPIENAALLPWLAATALLHAVLVDEHRAAEPPRVGTAALATLPFVLVVLGAALTRSGAVTSVHAFAEATAVGQAILAILVVVTAVAMLVLTRGWRAQPEPRWRWSGRRVALRVNTALLLGAALVVGTGTVYPLAASLAGDRVLVGGDYFSRLLAPLALVVLALVGVAPHLRWGRGARPGLARTAPVAVVAGAGVATWVQLVGTGGAFAVGALGLAAASGVLLTGDLVGRLRSRAPAAARRRAVGAALSHLGAVVLLAGFAGSTLATTTTALLRRGESVTVAGSTIRHEGVEVEDLVAGRRVSVRVDVGDGGRERARLHPAQTVFPDLGLVRGDPDLRSTPLEDLQVSLRRLDADGTALLDVAVRPLVAWVWWGGLLLVIGVSLVLTGGPGAGPARASARREDQAQVPAVLGAAP